MLKSEIYELERSVAILLDEKNTGQPASDEHQIAGQITHIQNLCSELQKKWTRAFFSSTKEPVINRYVRYHQAGIGRLSDKLSRYAPDCGPAEGKRRLPTKSRGQLLEVLENLLDFLRNHFYPYFDTDQKTTGYHCALLQSKSSDFEQELHAYDHNQVDHSLIAVVINSVNELWAEGLAGGISYRQADRALNLIRMIHQLLFSGKDTTTEAVITALYQQNLNTLHFFNWYQDYFLRQAASGIKTKRKLFIDDQLKTLSSIFVNPEKALQPGLPSSDQFLLPWIRQQADSPKKMIDSHQPLQMPLHLSVTQFALFIRIFYKAGCFATENVAMIISFFTIHFATKKQPHISSKSFKRAFYNLDQSAAAIVRDYLQKMLSYINKIYFP